MSQAQSMLLDRLRRIHWAALFFRYQLPLTAGVIGVGAALAVLKSWFALAALTAMLCVAVVAWSAQQRTLRTGVERDLPVFLLALAASLKSGASPCDALLRCGEHFKGSLLGLEIDRFRARILSGRSEADAIATFGQEVPHPDLELFKSAYTISIRCGASLTGGLMRLSRVTRQRQSFARKSRAAVAAQKISLYAISGLVLIFVMVQVTLNQQAFLGVLSNPVGSRMLWAGSGLVLTGIVWMLTITSRRW